jgi:hypothetical protein
MRRKPVAKSELTYLKARELSVFVPKKSIAETYIIVAIGLPGNMYPTISSLTTLI